MLGKYVCWRTICDFVVTSDFFANVKFYKEKKTLYLSVSVFCTKVLLGDTILTEPPFYVVIQAMRRSSHLQGKGSTLISQSF